MESVRIPWQEAKEKIQQATREFEQKLRGLEAPIFEGILEYLIHHYTRPEKCTLREMERELGVPYTRLKRLVDKLKKEGILTETGVGTAKVLTVSDLERAIELGYLSGDLDKLQGWSTLPFLEPPAEEEGDQQFRDRVWRAALFSRGTGSPPTMRAVDCICNRCDCHIFWASCKRLMTQESVSVEDPRIKHRTQSIEDWNQGVMEFWSRFVSTHGEGDEVSRLLHDEALEVRIAEGIEGIERIVYRIGFVPLYILPYLHSIVGPHGQREKGERTLFFHKAILARDVWFEMNCPEQCSFEEGWQATIRVFEKQLKYLMVLIRPVLQLIEENGVEGTLYLLSQPVNTETKPRPVPPYTRTNLLYHALPLIYAALIVLGVGGDVELFRQGKRMAQTLRAAVERGYRGKEVEGVEIEKWFERQ